MPKAAHKVVVIGHRNPDTDSICSAIAYAELKNKTSDLVCEPRRAGKMNQETEFVLKKFGVKPPRMCTDVNPKIRDVDYREMPGIPGSTSLRKAWEIMRDKQIDTLPVTSPDNELEGVITVKDIATANMDVFDTGILAKSQTTYRNILETLGGTMVVGREDDVCTTGHIRIGTATPEMLENTVEKGDIVILTNRYESQLCAIEKEASLLIICNGSKVGRTIQRIAEEMGVAIMSAPVDTYAAGKLISQCAPISYYMTRSDIMKFTLVTPVADVTRVMAKVRHRYSPSSTRTANTAAWSAAATSSICKNAASSWWTTTRPPRPWRASIRPKFWRSSITTASAVWRPAARCTSATSRWAALPPSSPRCTTRTV